MKFDNRNTKNIRKQYSSNDFGKMSKTIKLKERTEFLMKALYAMLTVGMLGVTLYYFIQLI